MNLLACVFDSHWIVSTMGHRHRTMTLRKKRHKIWYAALFVYREKSRMNNNRNIAFRNQRVRRHRRGRRCCHWKMASSKTIHLTIMIIMMNKRETQTIRKLHFHCVALLTGYTHKIPQHFSCRNGFTTLFQIILSLNGGLKISCTTKKEKKPRNY